MKTRPSRPVNLYALAEIMNLSWRTLLLATTAVVALSALPPQPAFAVPTNTTTYTSSSAEVDTIIDTPVTQQVNAYSTELTAELQGGPVLYDQTFLVPFADPVFQSATAPRNRC
jgi:hypothetical protein